MDHQSYSDFATNSVNPYYLHLNEKFIDGSFLKPFISDPLLPQWISCNTMVLSGIQRSISYAIAKFVLWIDATASVWKNLQVRFSRSDIFRISDIQEEIYRSHQSPYNGKGYQFHKGKWTYPSKGANRVCIHCGRTNHTVDTCFLKHGYPPDFKQKGKDQNSKQGSS
ncbi:hypothetical protein KIW84_053453 [Lathyrus oleraceus]|uniref:Uncharacterized protein n=1 Tax=Pisum sativum TaxID=3888 RepID=A0A9D4WV46_PEA|nr:hypothetical protein KIW84_053453 [Pisum sativum]